MRLSFPSTDQRDQSDQEHVPPSVLKDVHTFFALCIGDDSEYVYAELHRYVSAHWAAESLHSWLSQNPPTWHETILSAADDILRRSVKLPREYSFVPDMLIDAPKDLLPASPAARRATLLENIIFLYYLDKNRDLTVQALQEKQRTPPGAAFHICTLERAAVQALLVKQAAAVASDATVGVQEALQRAADVLGGADLLAHPQFALQFLNGIRPEQRLLAVLQCKPGLQALGLQHVALDAAVVAPNFAQFSFMIDDTSALGKRYSQLLQLLRGPPGAVIAHMRSLITGAAEATERYTFRFLLVLALYYGFFNARQECATAVQLLQQGDFKTLLQIQPHELPAYMFLARGPRAATQSFFPNGIPFFQ